jgi:hypothetical protein
MAGMNDNGLFSSVPKLIALCAVFPLLLVLLWLTWQAWGKSRDVQVNWAQVQARVAAVQDSTVTLEFPLKGNKVRSDVKREYTFKTVQPEQMLPLYVSPADPAQVKPVSFGQLWGGTIALGVVSALLAAVGIVLLRVGEDKTEAHLLERFKRDMDAARLNSASPDENQAARREDDGRAIEMREPGQSWKANVFWGSLGLLAIVPSLLAPPETSFVERWGTAALGLAWMIFMGLSAYRNFGRTVRCDDSFVVVSQAFGAKRVALADVKKVIREDVRQQLRDIDNIGVTRYAKMKRLDTKAAMIMYVLQDAQGKTLLRLDKDMEPASEMRRFLDRLENRTGAIG